MEITDNKLVVRRFIEDLFNQGRYAVLDEVLAARWVGHSSGQTQDQAEFEQAVRAHRTAFPNLHYVVEDQLAEDDRVATRWTFTGTQTGTMQGIPPSSRLVTVTGMAIDRVVDGILLESWFEVDINGLLQQLGVAPVPAGA
jgi:predicted ester cyclase